MMRLGGLVTILILGLFPSMGFAHKLMIEPKFEGNRIRVEAFFDDDSPADDAVVHLLSATGEPLLEGKTNENGVWYFDKPQPGDYTLRVNCIGHIGKNKFTVGEDVPSASSSRREQTQVPWFRVGLGLGVILGLSLLWWKTRRDRASAANRVDS